MHRVVQYGHALRVVRFSNNSCPLIFLRETSDTTTIIYVYSSIRMWMLGNYAIFGDSYSHTFSCLRFTKYFVFILVDLRFRHGCESQRCGAGGLVRLLTHKGLECDALE